MKTLEKLLVQLGFDELQGRLYSELYFQGSSTVLELSRKTGIKRPTVHFHVEQLIERGAISESVKSGRRVLVAADPSTFVSIVEEKKQHALQTENSLSRVLSEVANLNGRGATRGLSIMVEEGAESLKQIYKEAFEYGEVYSYFDFDKGVKLEKLRHSFFDNVVIRKMLSSFTELYHTKEIKTPKFVKSARAFEQFSFSKTGMRLYGDAVNVLVYGQDIVIITLEDDWRVLKLSQPILAMFIREMIEIQIV